jgi:hypothetical protein
MSVMNKIKKAITAHIPELLHTTDLILSEQVVVYTMRPGYRAVIIHFPAMGLCPGYASLP